MAWLGDEQAGVVVIKHCVDKLGNTFFEVPKTLARLDKTAFSAIKEHSVQVVTIEMVLFEWIRKASDESFGSMLRLGKHLRQIKAANS